MSVNPDVLRWVIGAIGLAVIAGVNAVMALEQFDWKGVLVAFAMGFGGALLGSLKTFPWNRKDVISELPKWIQNFLEGDESSVPPAPGFLDAPATPATTTLDDLHQ